MNSPCVFVVQVGFLLSFASPLTIPIGILPTSILSYWSGRLFHWENHLQMGQSEGNLQHKQSGKLVIYGSTRIYTRFPIIFFFPVVTSRFFFISDLDFQAFFFQNIRVCDLSNKGCAWNVPVRRRMTSVTNFGNQHFPLAQGHAHCQTCHSGKVVIGSDCKAGEVNMQTSTVCHQLFMFCRDAFDFSHWQRMQMDDSCIEPFQN